MSPKPSPRAKRKNTKTAKSPGKSNNKKLGKNLGKRPATRAQKQKLKQRASVRSPRARRYKTRDEQMVFNMIQNERQRTGMLEQQFKSLPEHSKFQVVQNMANTISQLYNQLNRSVKK